MEFNTQEAASFYEEEVSVTAAAKRYCQENGIPYENKYRLRLSRYLNTPYNTLDNDTETSTAQYSNDKEGEQENVTSMPSAWDTGLNRFLNIDEYCDKWGLPKDMVRSSKLVAHVAGHMVYNIAFNPTIQEQTGIDEDFLLNLINKWVEPVEVPKITNGDYNWVDRLVYTDVHIGMDVNAKDGNPLYDGKWDADEVYERVSAMADTAVSLQKGDTLYIDDLGDLMDGLGGMTVRKQHQLPQNMTDAESFDTAVSMKLKLIELLLPYYGKIVCNSITNDNHSGIFSYMVNAAVKGIVEAKYPTRVTYNINRRFMEHYKVGHHTIILCHGKDGEALKFGFKPFLDSKQAEKIDQYCKEHRLYDGRRIEFSKGDSHQAVFDYTTSNDFDYCSYPALSPASNWVKTNFKNSKSGFVFYNMDRDSHTKVMTSIFF
jgi:hypothetical protein